MNKFKKKIIHLKLWLARLKDNFTKIRIIFDEFPEKINSRSDLSSTNISVRRLKKGIKSKNINTIALLGNFSSGKSSIVSSSLNKKRAIFIYPLGENNSFKETLLNCLIKNDISSISPHQDTYRKYIRTKKLIKLFTISFLICVLLLCLFIGILYKFSNELKVFMYEKLDINFKAYWLFIFPFIVYIVVCIIGTISICNYYVSLKINGLEILTDKSQNYDIESTFTCIIFHLKRRKIKYVIFEDLDRNSDSEKWNFKKFKELRDFCLRINSSPQIKNPIKFIYCFNDSIFKTADERLKSFDLIIPVFPKMTMNNSYEELCNQDIIIEKNIPENELANLSVFISDQRLYNSIIAEFRMMCEQISSENYNEMFALCCIKNIYPIIYHELHINNNFYDTIVQKMNGELTNFSKYTSELDGKIGLLLKDENQIESNNASLLLRTCICNRYITSNYKSILHSGKTFLSPNDVDYLKNVAAMEETDPNLQLLNFEMILKRLYQLSNPKFFNISLMKYCIANNKNDYLFQIVESLSTKDSIKAINAILKSKEINEDEILYLTTKLYSNQYYVDIIIKSKNNDFIHHLLNNYIINKANYKNNLPLKINEKIKLFYYKQTDYFVKLDTEICFYILINYTGTFDVIPTIADEKRRQDIYDYIVLYNRYEITIANLCLLFDDFKISPLNHIINNENVSLYIGQKNKINIIKDLNRNEDSINDVIKLFKNSRINHSTLLGTKYIKQFYNSIDIATLDNMYYSIIEEFLVFNLLSFSDYNIIECASNINNECKYDEIEKFIRTSIENKVVYIIETDEKFNIELSLNLLISLSTNELIMIKNSIDVSIFDNANNLLKIKDIEKIKIFEKNITLSKATIINLLDNNIEFLKYLLKNCSKISYDMSDIMHYYYHTNDISKRSKLNQIQPFLKEKRCKVKT